MRIVQISVIIPALNEADCIGQVLAAIPVNSSSENITEILVVDGGSSDGTAAIAQAGGATVIPQIQRGYGGACAAGLAAAHGEIVVFMDADGADNPLHIPALAAPLLERKADLVLGSRLAGQIEIGAMPWHQRTGNRLSAWLIRRLYGLPLTDLSPFRAVARDKLLALDMQEMTYGWPTEMIVKAARNDWRITEIPVSYRIRQGGKSKISGTWKGSVLATYFILLTIWTYARR